MPEREDVLASTLGDGAGHCELEVAADQHAGDGAAGNELGVEGRARPRRRDRPERALEHAARRVAEPAAVNCSPDAAPVTSLGARPAQALVEQTRRQGAADELETVGIVAGGDAADGGCAGSLVRSRIAPIGVMPAMASLANDHEKATAPAS